jgi:periplasmic copper chaperone A
MSAALLRRIGIVGAATTATVLLFAGPALAHITVSPDTVVAGSTDVLTFHVPNESAKADTVKVDVQIPTDHPIAQLLVEPVPGWTASVKTITLAKPIVTDDGKFTQAVSEVIWSGGKIPPGQFQSFSISADPMPTGESHVTFKAIQTYSDGSVVRWIDVQQPGQPEVAHPAPTVTLTTGTAAGAPAKATTATTAASSSSDGLARILAIAGLLIALLAGLLALTVVRQARRLASRPSPAPVSSAETEKTEPAKAQSAKTTDQREPVAAGAKPSTSSKSTAKRGQPQPRRRG